MTLAATLLLVLSPQAKSSKFSPHLEEIFFFFFCFKIVGVAKI